MTPGLLLQPLTRLELDALTAEAEHAYTKAHIAFTNAPMRSDALQAAAGVAQDAMALCTDCYEASMLLSAAEMDRILGY